MAPPGRVGAALGSALRAVVVSVLILMGIGGAAGIVVVTPNFVAAPFTFVIGVFLGAIAGAAAGAVHAAAQIVLMLAIPAHRRRPWSPAVAVVVSAALAGAALAIASREPDTSPGELVAYGLAGLAYTGFTWPMANAVVPPGRPRRARRTVAPVASEPSPWG